MNHDAGILAQFPGELAATDIDRINTPGATSQQYIGKTAGRGADIERDPTSRVDCELVERIGQLDTAARHPRVIATAYLDRNIGHESLASLVDPSATGKHTPREDQRLRACSTLGEAALHDQQISARFCRQASLVRGFSQPSAKRRQSGPRGLCCNLAAERRQCHCHDVAGIKTGEFVLRLRAVMVEKLIGQNHSANLQPVVE